MTNPKAQPNNSEPTLEEIANLGPMFVRAKVQQLEAEISYITERVKLREVIAVLNKSNPAFRLLKNNAKFKRELRKCYKIAAILNT